MYRSLRFYISHEVRNRLMNVILFTSWITFTEKKGDKKMAHYFGYTRIALLEEKSNFRVFWRFKVFRDKFITCFACSLKHFANLTWWGKTLKLQAFSYFSTCWLTTFWKVRWISYVCWRWGYSWSSFNPNFYDNIKNALGFRSQTSELRSLFS